MIKIMLLLVSCLLISGLNAVPFWSDAAGIVLSVADVAYDGENIWVANQQGNLQCVSITGEGEIYHNFFLSISGLQSLSEDNGWLVACTSQNWNLLNINDISNPSIQFQSIASTEFITAQISYPYVVIQSVHNQLSIYDITIPGQPLVVDNITLPHNIRKVLCNEGSIYASCSDSLFYRIGMTSGSVDSLMITSYARDMAAHDDIVYLVTANNHLLSVDATDPAQMHWEYFDTNTRIPLLVEIRGNLLAVVCSGWLIDYYYVNPGSPPEWQNYFMVWGANCLALTEDYTITGSGVSLYSINHTNLADTGLDWVITDIGSTLDIVYDNNHLFVASGISGLRIYDYQNAAMPVQVSVLTNINASQIIVCDTLLYVADNSAGLRIFGIGDITHPVQLGSYELSGGFWRMAKAGIYVYALRSSYGVRIIDVSEPQNPYLCGSYYLPGVQNIVVSDSIAFISNSGEGLYTLNLSNPTVPAVMGSYDMQGFAGGFSLNGQVAYVNNGYGISVINISNPTYMWQANFLDAEGVGYAMDNGPVIQDNYMMLWNNFANRLYIYDVTNSFYPTLISAYPWNRRIKDALWIGNKLLSTNEVLGFSQLNFPVPTEVNESILTPEISIRVSPNPFCQTCHFEAESGNKAIQSIRIYNIKGQLIKEMAGSSADKKTAAFSWDGKNRQGESCPAGIYLASVQAGGYNKTIKLLKLSSH